MLGNSILFYDDKHFNRRDAFRVLASTGANCLVVETIEDLENSLRLRPYSIVVVDISAHRHLIGAGFDLSKTPTVILSQEKFETLHPYLSTIEAFTFFIAKNADGALPLRDLLVTVKKILNMDIFGVEKYLNWGATRMIFHIRDSSTRQEYIDAAITFCNDMKLRKRHVDAVHRLCEEMLMNAFYDAPRDENGKELYQAKSRTEKVVLEPTLSARLEIASDGERLGVSVTDPYGAITRDIILAYLSKCFAGVQNLKVEPSQNPAKAGAGLGLYMCFASASALIVNVSPGIRTEFIGLIDIGLPAKDQTKYHPSFHYFSTNNRAPQFHPNIYRRA